MWNKCLSVDHWNLECLNFPWLAAPPDAFAVLNVSVGQIIATIEDKSIT
jgi:hypothetical protein